MFFSGMRWRSSIANQITNELSRGSNGSGLKLSNRATDVFLSVMLLGGSDIAKNDWEKKFLIWLAEKDIGGGAVGFDISEIGWSKAEFVRQKSFVLKVIDRAISKHGWSLLNYDPPFVASHLKDFRKLIEEFRFEFIKLPEVFGFIAEPTKYLKCERRDVFLHEIKKDPGLCCLICNNTPIE